MSMLKHADNIDVQINTTTCMYNQKFKTNMHKNDLLFAHDCSN